MTALPLLFDFSFRLLDPFFELPDRVSEAPGFIPRRFSLFPDPPLQLLDLLPLVGQNCPLGFQLSPQLANLCVSRRESASTFLHEAFRCLDLFPGAILCCSQLGL